MTNHGTMLWATDGTPSHELVEAVAHDVGLTVRFCALHDLAEQARTGMTHVIAIEVGSEPERALGLLAETHRRFPSASILLASHDGSVGFIRQALQAGASDVLSLPLQAGELHRALIRSLHAGPKSPAPADSGGEIITVCGARGGLGATTLAVNLAGKLAAVTGTEVGLVDLDLQRGDVAAFMNLTPHNSVANLATAPGEVDDVFLASTLMRHANGVFVLPAPLEMEEADSIGHAEIKLALDLLRARFRYTVVDTSRTITGATLAAIEASQRILLLTDLSVPGLRSARRTADLVSRLGIATDRVELIVTEAVSGPVTLQDAGRALGKSPFFVIPRDEASAAEAMNHGAPLNGKPTKLALAMVELATKVAGVPAAKPKSGQLLRKLFGRTERVSA